MVWKAKTKPVSPIPPVPVKKEEPEVLDESTEVEEEPEEEQEESKEEEEEKEEEKTNESPTLNDVLLNHEERLKNLESAFFRLKHI